MPKRRRTKPPQEYAAFERKLWRMVEGAVADVLRFHPDYVTKKGHVNITSSIGKRVVGTLRGYVENLDVGSPGREAKLR